MRTGIYIGEKLTLRTRRDFGTIERENRWEGKGGTWAFRERNTSYSAGDGTDGAAQEAEVLDRNVAAVRTDTATAAASVEKRHWSCSGGARRRGGEQQG